MNERQTTVTTALDLAAALAVGAGLYVAVAGPLRLDLAGVTLSIRTPTRPLLTALALIAIRLWLAARDPSLTHTSWAAAVSTRTARAALAGLVIAGVTGWWTFLSPTCGGADSYGYVSAADRVLNAHLVEMEPLAAILPFDRGIDAATPLGYVASGRTPNASVPAYPLGLPALMAIARLAGPLGPFVVAPFMGLLLLVAVCAIARNWYADADTTRLTCAFVALNPLVFTYAIQPMSDVPAAAAAVLGIAALTRPTRRPWQAGFAAALALLIRPALAPMALAIAAIPVVLSGWRAWKDSARCLIVVAAAVLVQGWSQWYLYGDPFGSGYGSVAALFSIERAWGNLRSYGYWSVRTIGPVWLGALAIGLAIGGRGPRRVMTLIVVSVGAPYLFYRPYDHWETLRFLLPLLAVGSIVAAAGVLTITRALTSAPFASAAAALLAVLMAASWMAWLSSNQVFTLQASEARHRVAAELAIETTPEAAVILALQHTGSLRYYAHRQTVNWDHIPQGQFDASVAALQRQGHPVYLMLDSQAEREMFEAKHGAVVDREGWLPNGQRGNVQLFAAPR
jgi:hypothetical protein